MPHRDAFGGPRATAAHSLGRSLQSVLPGGEPGRLLEAGRLEPRVGGDLLLVSRESRGAGSTPGSWELG